MSFWDFLFTNSTEELKIKDRTIANLSAQNIMLAKNLAESKANYQKLWDEDTQQLGQQTARINELVLQLKSKGKSEIELFWENKRPKIDRVYERQETDGKYLIDVRDFFTLQDSTISNVLKTFNVGVKNDDKALNCLLWVIDNIKYVPDKQSYGFDEYWAFPYQTLKRKLDDCEGGAILMANMMIISGIPAWRVHLNAGSVNGGGHTYVSYCREIDNQWCVLDWCFWPNRLPVAQRKLHKDEQNYLDLKRNFYVWFSFNPFYCWGEMRTMVGMPEQFKGLE